VRIFTLVGFTGHYPVGTSAVIVAVDAEHGAKLVNKELAAHGFTGMPQDGGKPDRPV
jgi:hypothetical protein